MDGHIKQLIKKILLAILIVLISAADGLGANVQATVDATSISQGESLNLKVSVDDSGAIVDTSSIKDFKVSPQGESTSIQIINSRYSKEVSHNFLLFPLKTGRLTIPALPVTENGKTVYTQPIQITVTDSPSTQSGSSDIFVRANVSKQNPYVGEQVVYRFQLYQAIDIANARLQEPDFKGFFSKKIGKQTTHQTILNGRNYTVTEVKYLLIADSPGELTVSPAVLTGSVARPGRMRNRGFPFDSFFNTVPMEPRHYMTKNIRLIIRPLPPLPDRLKSFSGLVGTFSITGNISDRKIQAGDSTTLSVTVKGEGNLIDLSRLSLSVPSEWKVYEDKPLEDINTGAQGFYGKKTFHYALIPVKAGDYSIAPVNLTYFDIKKNDYQTTSTDKLGVTVTAPAAPSQNMPVATTSAAPLKPHLQKKSVQVTGHDILPVKDDLTALKNQSPMRLPDYLFCIVVPPLLFCLISFFMMGVKRRNKPEKMLRKHALQLISDISSGRLNNDDMLTSLTQALCYAIRFKSSGSGVAITSSEVRRLLKPAGCSDPVIRSAEELLVTLESLKFSGMHPDRAIQSDIVAKSEKTIKQLCK